MFNNLELFKELNIEELKAKSEAWIKQYPSIISITLHSPVNNEFYKERYFIVWEVETISEEKLAKMPGYSLYKDLIADLRNNLDWESFFRERDSLFNQLKGLEKAIENYNQFKSVEFSIKAYSTKEIFNNDFYQVYKGESPINFRKDWIILKRWKGEPFPEAVLKANFIQLFPEKYLEGNPYKEKNNKAKKLLRFEIKNAYYDIEQFWKALKKQVKKQGFSVSNSTFEILKKAALEILERNGNQTIKKEYLIADRSKSILNLRNGGHEKQEFIKGVMFQHIKGLGFFLSKKEFEGIYEKTAARLKKSKNSR